MSVRVYYNDNEPFVCAWLRNLIAAGHLPAGDVDERPIEHVQASDLAGYDQCHFFAGIGGWAYALQLAGWGDRPVWTGSCPCQPVSAAGKRKAADDARHLWPEWFRLIRECKPQRIFGEQVANGIGFGWLDLVSTDLEAEAYTVGAIVLGAHSVGAPHIRQRLWFVADTEDADGRCRERGTETGARADRERRGRPTGGGPVGFLDDADRAQFAPRQESASEARDETWLPRPGSGRGVDDVADAERRPPERHGCELGRTASGDQGAAQERERVWPNSWDGCELIACRDGKSRPVPTEPALFPLAHGIPNRVGTLRGAGNAIVPPLAAAFVSAYMDVLGLESQP